jgi:hypothetical protein
MEPTMRNRATENIPIRSRLELLVILSLALGGCSAEGLAGPDEPAVTKIPIERHPPGSGIVLIQPPRPCILIQGGGCR